MHQNGLTLTYNLATESAKHEQHDINALKKKTNCRADATAVNFRHASQRRSITISLNATADRYTFQPIHRIFSPRNHTAATEHQNSTTRHKAV